MESVDAPGFQCLLLVVWDGEAGDIQIADRWCDSEPGEIARGEDCCIGCFGYSYMEATAGALRDGLSDPMRRAVEALQWVNGKDDGIGSGLFEPRGEVCRNLGQIGG